MEYKMADLAINESFLEKEIGKIWKSREISTKHTGLFTLLYKRFDKLVDAQKHIQTEYCIIPCAYAPSVNNQVCIRDNMQYQM